MTANEVVDKIAKERMVETIIGNVVGDATADTLNDLAQELYLQLLEDGQRTVELYEKKQLNFFLARIVCNQIKSSTSSYHRIYRAPMNKTVELEQCPNSI